MIYAFRNLRKTGILLAGIMAVSLSGCFSILPEPKPAPTIYRLTVPQSMAANPAPRTKVINIEYPTSPGALSGTDIVLSPDGRRLTSAALASWSEAVPNMLRNQLIDTLASEGQVIGVIPKGSTRVPYRLNMDIRRFEAVFDNGEDGAPLAMVQINLALTNAKTRQLIAVNTISTQARAGIKSVSSIVEAQDRATQEAMAEIANWLAAQTSMSAS